jgi:hypothetical protein
MHIRKVANSSVELYKFLTPHTQAEIWTHDLRIQSKKIEANKSKNFHAWMQPRNFTWKDKMCYHQNNSLSISSETVIAVL